MSSAGTTAYTKVCALSDLTPDVPAAADVDGVVVALVRKGESVYAVNDTCTHANVSLSEGEVDGCSLECWLHGSRFDLRTGEPTGPPATVPVATYPVRIDAGDVYVHTGNAGRLHPRVGTPAAGVVPVEQQEN